MNKNFIKTLKILGLSSLEIQIYLALLNFQKMSISEIARHTQIKRPTCYQHLDSLLKKEFIIRVPRGKRMFYSAVSPKKILNSFRKKYSSVEAVMAEMNKKHEQMIQKPKVIVYEGKKEIKKIYNEVFETVGDIYSVFPPTAFLENFSIEEYEKFDLDINDFKFRSKDLIVDDDNFQVVNKIRQKNFSKNKITKKLPKDFSNDVDMLIYNDKVALISLRDLSAVVIQNKNINDFFKKMHKFIWNKS